MRRLMTFRIIFLALAMAAMQVITSAQQGGVNRTATSTITTRNDKERGVVAQITNRRFTFTNYFHDQLGADEQPPTILLLEEFTSERSLSAEGQEGTVKIEAWTGKDANASKKMWTIEHEGDEGAIADRFYRVIKHGCCAAEGTGFYFNLMSGQKVFASTADLFQIEVPNTSQAFTRYVAFHSVHASAQSAESEKDQSVVGVIQYGSETKPMSRIILRGKTDAQRDLRLEKIKTRYQRKINDTSPLTLWGVDGKGAVSSLSAFSIILTFYEKVQVEIPVVNDRLEIGKAILPAGMTLHMAK